MSSSTTVYQYSLFCTTEGTTVYSWGTEGPTTCPNNNTHTINANSITVVQTISQTVRTVVEATDGGFQDLGIKMDIPSGSIGSISTKDITFPMDVQIWKSKLGIDSPNGLDELDIIIAPNTIVGVLTVNGSINDTTLNVSSTFFTFPHLYNGVEISLFDGVNEVDCGILTSHNSTTNTITIETPLTMNLSAGSTYVRISVHMVKNLILYTSDNPHIIGEKGFKFMPLYTRVIMRIKYKNNDGLAKIMHGSLEYYYK